VLVIEGGPEAGEPDDAAVIAALEARLAGGMTRRDAVVDVAGQLGAARRRVYDLALGIDGEE
ncbi:MAG: rRNA (cytidine-2'-O-)-methyltransferase, partial [Actinobacteria bacterium]|nr:rRNA (cytidine-2'-O-)-methyltransferase [Actinomycetota bacterium]